MEKSKGIIIGNSMDEILFETPRLTVRKLSLNDAELLFKYSREDIAKEELPDEEFENIEKANAAIEYFISNYDNGYPLCYEIILREII
jgi:hypothetical protein